MIGCSRQLISHSLRWQCGYRVLTDAAVPVARKARQTKNVEVKAEGLQFRDEAKNMLQKIKIAVSDMKSLNPTFNIELTDTCLFIDIGEKGAFIVQSDNVMENINLISPVSGALEYKYDPESQNWLSIRDNHDIRGLMTRDLVRICVGCPNF
eukprot:gene8357-17216_t